MSQQISDALELLSKKKMPLDRGGILTSKKGRGGGRERAIGWAWSLEVGQ